MRKIMITLAVAMMFVMMFAFGPQASAQMMGPGMMGQGGYGMMGPGMMGQGGYGQWNYCPYCGRPLPKGGYGHGMGPGMMGPGMMGGGMMGGGFGGMGGGFGGGMMGGF